MTCHRLYIVLYCCLSVEDVAVLGESELLAIMVMSKRKFQFIHGGVVHSSDVLGQRKGKCMLLHNYLQFQSFNL